MSEQTNTPKPLDTAYIALRDLHGYLRAQEVTDKAIREREDRREAILAEMVAESPEIQKIDSDLSELRSALAENDKARARLEAQAKKAALEQYEADPSTKKFFEGLLRVRNSTKTVFDKQAAIEWLWRSRIDLATFATMVNPVRAGFVSYAKLKPELHASLPLRKETNPTAAVYRDDLFHAAFEDTTPVALTGPEVDAGNEAKETGAQPTPANAPVLDVPDNVDDIEF